MFYVFNPEGVKLHGPMETITPQRKIEKIPVDVSHGLSTHTKKDNYLKSLNKNSVLAGRKAYDKVNYQKSSGKGTLFAHHIMSQPVKTLKPEVTILEAWHIFQKETIHHMPVVSSENKIIGIVSDRDLLKHIKIINDEIQYVTDTIVSDEMTTEVITSHPMTNIKHIAMVLCERKIGAMPIVDEKGMPIGIVSRTDILKAIINHPMLTIRV